MATFRASANRLASTQPMYDFLADGSTNSPPQLPGQTFRQSQAVKPDVGNEDLRAQVRTLQYELDSYKQDRELAKLRHEKELRDLQSRAEADFKRVQASEGDRNAATRKYEALATELKELQDQSATQQQDLEKKLRTAQDQNRSLQEEVDEAQAELASTAREHRHRLQEAENKHAALQRTMTELRADLETKTASLRTTQEQLTKRDGEVGSLEAEALRLRAAAGDVEELATLKRELSDQIAHIRKLETANREQTAELRHLRQVHKAVGVVEEEKRALGLRLDRMNDLERELGEAKFQRQLLEDERKAWAAYLQEPGAEGEAPEFDSPGAIVRALAGERLEKASLLERLGAVQPQVSEKESIIRTLEAERERLRGDVAKLKASGGGGDSRARGRLERQKALAVKEVEYLRDQLRTFDAEDVTGEIRTDDEQQSRQRVSELEGLVARYRVELEAAHAELSTREAEPAPVAPQGRHPLKRLHAEDADNDSGYDSGEQIGALSRKNRKLQSDVSDLSTQNALLAKDLHAARTELSALQATARTRVLELRANPTADFEARKLSTIAKLREANAALLEKRLLPGGAQGEGADARSVPAAALEAVRLELDEARAEARDREKTIRRLKQVWSDKCLEMREAIASLLGWDMAFLPNGRFKLTSILGPAAKRAADGAEAERTEEGPLQQDDDDDDDDDDVERSITFDGERGSMKISGGPHGVFGAEVGALIRFWMDARHSVPGFLAALTLENLERARGGGGGGGGGGAGGEGEEAGTGVI